jgi:hypothetical protein
LADVVDNRYRAVLGVFLASDGAAAYGLTD